jgi:hypothetical protein
MFEFNMYILIRSVEKLRDVFFFFFFYLRSLGSEVEATGSSGVCCFLVLTSC